MTTKTPKAPKTPVSLLISTERSNGYFHIRTRPIVLDPATGKTIGPDSYGLTNGLYLYNLETSCQGDVSHAASTGLYGFSVYYAPFHVELRDAERMHKTLKTIAARLERLETARGYVTTYGEYVARVAEAIGAETISRRKEAGSLYMDGREYQEMTPGAGRSHIDGLERTWKDSITAAA